MLFQIVVTLCVAIVPFGASLASVAEEPWLSERIEVTATRVPEPVDNVPAAISVVTGDELRARGASDLRTALGLFAGVEASPGGDGGPAGAVPSLWGLREADAYLLVIDNVPWGGAFNPATPSVDLTGVEKIEVLRGAAPVMFGATSFVGVIHVIHYAAGHVPATAAVTVGIHGSAGIAVSTNLPSIGDFGQSLTVNAEKQGFVEDRTQFRRLHALYRGATKVGETRFHVDADVSLLPQDPSGNFMLRDGSSLHPELPPNANYNPAGAKLNQNRYHVALGLDGQMRFGDWSATIAATRTQDAILRGFLRGDAFAAPPDAGVGDGFQADGFTQSRTLTDLYLDAHVNSSPTNWISLTYGFDHLHGSGRQNAINFGYCIDIAGVEQACDGAHHADEIVSSSDRRDFSGLYFQSDIKANDFVDVLFGARWNHTREVASGLAIDNTGPAPEVAFDGSDSRTTTRLSGLVGVSWHVWRAGANGLTFYTDYRNSFKPLAIDFGPEAEVQVLKPELAHSYEFGLKTQLLDGALDIDASAFQMDFHNGLTYSDDGSGNYVRTNGGQTRFKGVEIESTLELSSNLRISGHYANHDARFVTFTRDNGADAAGNHFEMSPRQLGGVGVLVGKPDGVTASVVATYNGERFLNKSNSVRVGGYTTLDASLGFRLGKVGIRLTGANLTDRRDAISESDLHEAVTVTATAGYYRMPGRNVRLTFNVDL